MTDETDADGSDETGGLLRQGAGGRSLGLRRAVRAASGGDASGGRASARAVAAQPDRSVGRRPGGPGRGPGAAGRVRGPAADAVPDLAASGRPSSGSASCVGTRRRRGATSAASGRWSGPTTRPRPRAGGSPRPGRRPASRPRRATWRAGSMRCSTGCPSPTARSWACGPSRGCRTRRPAARLEIEPAAARKRYGRALLRLRALMLAEGLTESQPCGPTPDRPDIGIALPESASVAEPRRRRPRRWWPGRPTSSSSGWPAGESPDVDEFVRRYPAGRRGAAPGPARARAAQGPGPVRSPTPAASWASSGSSARSAAAGWGSSTRPSRSRWAAAWP